MDVTTALARFEAALSDQVAVVSDDPAIERAARALLAGLAPAGRQLALDLAEQAADELRAQMPDAEVEVVLRAGEPVLSIRDTPSEPGPEIDEDYAARITLRLPPSLKGLIEDAASTRGDSVNGFVVDALSGAAHRQRRASGGRVRGRVAT